MPYEFYNQSIRCCNRERKGEMREVKKTLKWKKLKLMEVAYLMNDQKPKYVNSFVFFCAKHLFVPRGFYSNRNISYTKQVFHMDCTLVMICCAIFVFSQVESRVFVFSFSCLIVLESL